MVGGDTHDRSRAARRNGARFGGHSCLKSMRGFTLIEVEIAIVLFVMGILGFIGYTRVNGSLISSVEAQRAVDGYLDLDSQRAIVIITGTPGSTGAPACNVWLEDIDDSGPYPVAEISVGRAMP